MIKGAYLDPAGSLATTVTGSVWEHAIPVVYSGWRMMEVVDGSIHTRHCRSAGVRDSQFQIQLHVYLNRRLGAVK